MQEVIEFCEKWRKEVETYNPPTGVPAITKVATLQHINKLLSLLRAKPSAGELTKKIRELYPKGFGANISYGDIHDACALLDASRAENEKMKESLGKLQQWAKAYPLEVFPEPDFKKVRKALKEYGISLDAVSASNMRHVITQANKIIEQAQKETP